MLCRYVSYCSLTFITFPFFLIVLFPCSVPVGRKSVFVNCVDWMCWRTILVLRVFLVTRQITCGFWIWSLNSLDCHGYNYSYSLHKFTTHGPETCLLVRHHFTPYLSCHPESLLSVSVLTVCRLSPLNSVSSASPCLFWTSAVWCFLSSASSDLLRSPPTSLSVDSWLTVLLFR
jgi:hypothetical protein